MADTDYRHGEMDIHQHELTFRGVMRLTKWGCLAIAVTLLFLSMWLAAGTGLIAASIAAVVVLIAGVMLLRGKHRPPAPH